MKLQDLFEKTSMGRPIVCVDVQPEYSGMMDGGESPVFNEIIEFVNNSRGPCLMFVNAEQDELTYDSIAGIKLYWEDSGFDSYNWSRVEVVDKGYGYLRAWMDNGVPESTIIKFIREMYKRGINDSRDLDDDYMVEFGPDQSLWDDPLLIGWAAIDQLKKYNNCYLVGGGRDECLKEVAILMNAFNIKYKMIDHLIYG